MNTFLILFIAYVLSANTIISQASRRVFGSNILLTLLVQLIILTGFLNFFPHISPLSARDQVRITPALIYREKARRVNALVP